jgi:hypothetical protein
MITNYNQGRRKKPGDLRWNDADRRSSVFIGDYFDDRRSSVSRSGVIYES